MLFIINIACSKRGFNIYKNTIFFENPIIELNLIKLVKTIWYKIIYKINSLTFEGLYFDIKIKGNQIIRIRFW
jgi:hypothetical protein